MVMWYVEGFADRRGAEEVQEELAAEKKATKEAKAALEALSLKHSKCEVTQDLQVKCDEGEKETSRLKLALRQVGEKSKEQEGELADLCTENVRLE